MKKKSKPFVVIDKSPAFPSTEYYDEKPVGSNDGMTKREYMATHILQGLCANSIPGSHHMPEERAKEAVEQADYLLKYLKGITKMKLQHKFKSGDKVHLRHTRKDGFETLSDSSGINWAEEETPKLIVGKQYVIDDCLADSITLKGYEYFHPHQKFTKV